MQIGNMQEFREQQMGKVKKRMEEEKKIKKGIYQMQVMIDAQSQETFDKECKRTEKQNPGQKTEGEKSDTKRREAKKLDAQTEMEKMLSVGRKFISMNSQVV